MTNRNQEKKADLANNIVVFYPDQENITWYKIDDPNRKFSKAILEEMIENSLLKLTSSSSNLELQKLPVINIARPSTSKVTPQISIASNVNLLNSLTEQIRSDVKALYNEHSFMSADKIRQYNLEQWLC